jgi:cytochrome bd-type quinol oxidase subunit 2
MKLITKHILSFTLIAGIMSLPMLVGAQWEPTEGLDGSGLNNTEAETLLSTILNVFLGLIAILAVIGFVISGVMYITAGGSSDRVDAAQNWLKYSIIGVVIALIGYIVVNFVSRIFVENRA